MKKAQLSRALPNAAEVKLGPISLRNNVTSRNEFLAPGMPFYALINGTHFNDSQQFDPRGVFEVMNTVNIESEFQKLSGIKKKHQLKSDVICKLCDNIGINLILFDMMTDHQTLFEFIKFATKMISSIGVFVNDNPLQFKRDHERVSKFILEIKAYIVAVTVPCLINQRRFSDAISTANDALTKISKLKSSYAIQRGCVVTLYSGLSMAYLFDDQLIEADTALKRAMVECKKLKSPDYQEAQNDIIQATQKFFQYYTDKDLLKIMCYITLAKENINVRGMPFGEVLKNLECLILPKVSEFFTKLASQSSELLNISTLCGMDAESGDLLIKLNSSVLCGLLYEQIKKSTYPVRTNILTDSSQKQFDLAVTIISQNHLDAFLGCCLIAFEKSKKLEVKKTRALVDVPINRVAREPVDPSYNPYAYADNLSDDLYPTTVKKNVTRATFRRSLEHWKKELKARREGEFTAPQVLPINFKNTGCIYDKKISSNVVAIEFMGSGDIWYGVLNPVIVELIPQPVRQQIIDKFKTGVWPQAAYEDCRQEMKNKSRQTGNKELKNYILKIRVLGHEFGEIRIVGKVIETVENPNCKGRFCNLLAFTGFALNGHKDLPICYEMPKLKADGSSSENDDTNSSPDDSAESNMSRSSLDM